MSLEDKVKWVEREDREISSLDFYREHYDSLPRRQLRNKDPNLYRRLKKDGFLEFVPTVKRDFGDNPVAYYTERYKGLTRGQLKKKDPGLYERIKRDGFLKFVPKMANMKPFEKIHKLY